MFHTASRLKIIGKKARAYAQNGRYLSDTVEQDVDKFYAYAHSSAFSLEISVSRFTAFSFHNYNNIRQTYSSFCSPGHNQNWICSDVIELQKMAPTLRDAKRRHISALFSELKCSFPTALWEPYL